MALIVHIREDGSLSIDPRGDTPDAHLIPSSTLERWDVVPGKPITFASDDGEATYTFAGFGTRLRKGAEVADHKVLRYERVTDA